MLPAAFLVSGLATWLVGFAPGNSLIETYIGYFASAFLFIVVAALVAPSHRWRVAVVLALLQFVLGFSISAIAINIDPSLRELVLNRSGYQAIGVSIMGTLLGVLSIYLSEPRKSKARKKSSASATKRKAPASSK